MGSTPTYDTRPMSPPWSKLLDIDRLVDSRTDIDFTVQLEELGRLSPGLTGSVAGLVRFERVAGLPVADLTMRGTAQLTCQRCLGPLEIPLERQARMGLIFAQADMERVPEELEPVLAPEGRTSIGALVEEELLLSLPIVPQHAEGEPCGAAEAPRKAAADAPPTQRPFEGLDKLLGRK